MVDIIFRELEFFKGTFSRSRTWLWFCLTTLAFMGNCDPIGGVAGLVRTLGLEAAAYESMLGLFHSSAVNRASRLETAADHGSIFISEDTYNLVRESIDAIELEPIHLKGIGEFKARKVVGTIDSASISVNLGKRNLSLVLDRLSETELEMTKTSLQQALRELDSFSKP